MSKRKKIGLSPGTLVYTGDHAHSQTSLRSLYYSIDTLKEYRNFSGRNIHIGLKNWLDVSGVQDSKLIQEIGNEYKIHPLVLEDVMDVTNRVKLDTYDNGIFCVLQFLKIIPESNKIHSEQVSIYFGEDFLISFQQDPDDTFEVLRKRMQIENSRLRTKKCDYLFYAIIDYIVDCYFLITDEFDTEINTIEERVHMGLDDELVTDLYNIRAKLIKFRNIIYPIREEIGRIKKSESQLIQNDTILYFRDLEDHLIQLIEIADSQRELLNGIKDLIYSQSSLKLNKDIKWLTVLSTISIPIVLMTGIYGMNFKNMPELEWHYGYLIWWIITITAIASLFLWFKRKDLF